MFAPINSTLVHSVSLNVARNHSSCLMFFVQISARTANVIDLIGFSHNKESVLGCLYHSHLQPSDRCRKVIHLCDAQYRLPAVEDVVLVKSLIAYRDTRWEKVESRSGLSTGSI